MSGVTANIQDLSRREVFDLFLNEELVRKIISETNKYGVTNADFVSVTDSELKVFISLNIFPNKIESNKTIDIRPHMVIRANCQLNATDV